MEQNQNAETMEQMQQRIRALIELGKKNGKVTSKQLFHTLDAIDADEKQTEKIYDALEHAGIEIDVSDVAEIVASASDLLPTDSEILQLERSGETVSESDNLADLESDEANLTDPVRMYLKSAPGRIRSQALSRPRHAASGSDPGGEHGPFEGSGEV